MRWPEFRVTHRKNVIKRVEWIPGDSSPVGSLAADLTGMKVMRLERVVEVDGLPTVTVTFMGRLVEVEEEDE